MSITKFLRTLKEKCSRWSISTKIKISIIILGLHRLSHFFILSRLPIECNSSKYLFLHVQQNYYKILCWTVKRSRTYLPNSANPLFDKNPQYIITVLLINTTWLFASGRCLHFLWQFEPVSIANGQVTGSITTPSSILAYKKWPKRHTMISLKSVCYIFLFFFF